MKHTFSFAARLSSVAVAVALLSPALASAQNIAIVNGKAVPKARVDALMDQVKQQVQNTGQQLPPDIDKRLRDEVVLREILVQEAERLQLATSPSYRAQMELARQGILLKELTANFRKNNPVSEAEKQAEYDKFKAQSSSEKEYHARHILVETEDEAKALIAQIKGGASFEDLAQKVSKDTTSGQNGGDLFWSDAGGYVPEFSQAMTALAKGAMTETPVHTQYGWHIVRLDDIRDIQLPTYDEVKTKIAERLEQQKLTTYRDGIKAKAKTDYKFE